MPRARSAGETSPRARARASRGRAPASLRIRDFLALVHDAVTSGAQTAARRMQTRQRFGYLQYFRGDPRVHYEVWVQRKTARIEIGLHFEGERDRNYAAAAALADHTDEVVAAVGPEYELEEWTAQWTRLHRSLPAPILTPELAAETAEQAAALIQGLEPLVERLGLRAAAR